MRTGTSKTIFVPHKDNNVSELSNPRFMRKKNDTIIEVGSNSRKNHDKNDQTYKICYISPKKVINPQDGSCNSYQTLKTPATLTSKLANSATGINQINDQFMSSTSSLTTKKYLESSREGAKNMVEKSKTVSQENYELKKENLELKAKLQNKHSQLSEIMEQKQKLAQKICALKQVLVEKDQLIRRLQDSLQMTEQALKTTKTSLGKQQENSSKLDAIIQGLYTLKDEDSKITLSSDFDQEDKQILRYKNEIEALNSKLKYFNIQQSMINKVKFDLTQETLKSERLKTQNKKLVGKLQAMVRQTERKTVSRKKQVRMMKRESEISLELSPQK